MPAADDSNLASGDITTLGQARSMEVALRFGTTASAGLVVSREMAFIPLRARSDPRGVSHGAEGARVVGAEQTSRKAGTKALRSNKASDTGSGTADLWPISIDPVPQAADREI